MTPTAPVTATASHGDIDDEASPDDDDAPAHPEASLSGEAAAMALLRSDLGATVIEQPAD
ncbi:hypothetical protein [Frankia sp. CIT1]|nr:hypothetical protein [Frankia sp. CIT1]